MSCPSDVKFIQRKQLLVAAMEKAVRGHNAVARKSYGTGDPITFCRREDILDDVVRLYFDLVESFKYDHRFPDGSQVNQSKRAALMYRALTDFDLSPLFGVSKELPLDLRAAYEVSLVRNLVVPAAIYITICTILEIDVAKVPKNIKKDFYVCIRKKLEISQEWLSLAMWLFCAACGKERQVGA